MTTASSSRTRDQLVERSCRRAEILRLAALRARPCPAPDRPVRAPRVVTRPR